MKAGILAAPSLVYYIDFVPISWSWVKHHFHGFSSRRRQNDGLRLFTNQQCMKNDSQQRGKTLWRTINLLLLAFSLNQIRRHLVWLRSDQPQWPRSVRWRNSRLLRRCLYNVARNLTFILQALNQNRILTIRWLWLLQCKHLVLSI